MNPPLQPLPTRTVSQTPNTQTTIEHIPSQPISYSAPIRRRPPESEPSDPDDRPIKPMKNTSVYNKPPSREKINQPKKPLPPLKRIQSSHLDTSDRLLSASKPVQSSPIYKPDSLPPPSPPKRINNISNRRPIQTNIKTLYDNDIDTPPQRNQHRQTIRKEYHDDNDYVDDNDGYYPVVYYIRSASKKRTPYQQIPSATRREMNSYQIPQGRRMIRFDPPIDTIIYRT